MNITLTGFMGTGKTVVGRRLAQQLGWAFVNLDSLIEATARKSVATIFAEHSEAVFRRLETRAIRRAMRGDQQVVATGGGAFVNPQNRALLRSGGPVICLTAHPKVILQRVTPTLSSRPMLASLPAAPRGAAQAGSQPLARIGQLLAQRASAYAKADLTIDTSRLSIEEVMERIWEEVGPWMSRSWEYLRRHGDKLTQRYGGKYVVVLDDRIVAAGATQLEAYQRLARPVPPRCEVGIYYIPSSEEPAIAL